LRPRSPPQPAGTEAEAIRHFFDKPQDCLFQHQQSGARFTWPPDSERQALVLGWNVFTFEDLYVKSLGYRLAFVQNWGISDRDELVICHFATATRDLRRRGIGTALARFIATTIREKYGVRRIVFAEQANRSEDDGFFGTRLGAQKVEDDKRWKDPVWYWTP
jgi:ribosomal protein S18 acetylase RimI-like enzyme